MSEGYRLQKLFCLMNNYPFFATERCPACDGLVFSDEPEREPSPHSFFPWEDDGTGKLVYHGYTKEEAGSRLITRCKRCNYSFLD